MRKTLQILKKNHSKGGTDLWKKRDREIAETVSDFLIQEEKSPATVQKYMRELQRLTVF